MADFKNLKLWHNAHRLALLTYRATARFPRSERYSLADQMRRAAVSIGSNVAEGCGRGGNAEFIRYLRIASASAHELESQLLLARDLGFLTGESGNELEREVIGVKRMLAGLIGRRARIRESGDRVQGVAEGPHSSNGPDT